MTFDAYCKKNNITGESKKDFSKYLDEMKYDISQITSEDAWDEVFVDFVNGLFDGLFDED